MSWQCSARRETNSRVGRWDERRDPRAMEAFFTFVDGLLKKKLDRDGEGALMVVVSVVELFCYQCTLGRRLLRNPRKE